MGEIYEFSNNSQKEIEALIEKLSEEYDDLEDQLLDLEDFMPDEDDAREYVLWKEEYSAIEKRMAEIEKDRIYYRRSGGGVTLSGGESLAQPDFAAALLRAAKEEYGMSTAIESTACDPYEEIQKLLPYLDLYLMDIKHMDEKKHKEYTGVDNRLILENARKIAASGVELIIRTPVIPSFNDTAEEIKAISKFASSLPGVKEHHLLPYHRLGTDKYEGLGRKYLLPQIEPPTKERMEYLLSVAEASGLICKIGG